MARVHDGLSDEIRSSLERHPGNGAPPPEGVPHDPFAVNVTAALEALNADWSRVYLIACVGGWWRACLLDGTGDVLTGLAPDDLAVKMRAGWESRDATGDPR